VDVHVEEALLQVLLLLPARDLLAAVLGVARGEREEDVRGLSGRTGAVNVGRNLAGFERREAEREAELLGALVEGEERQPERRAGCGRGLLRAVQERDEGLRARGQCGQRDERGQQSDSERRAVSASSHVHPPLPWSGAENLPEPQDEAPAERDLRREAV